MKRIGMTLLTVIVLMSSGCSVLRYADKQNQPDTTELGNQNAPVYAINNVHVIDVKSGQIERDRMLVIRDGVIAAIQPKDSPATDLPVIEGKGRYVLPGLIDMHVHVHDRTGLMSNLAYGVTTVRNMRGMPMHLRWRDEVRQGNWLGADMLTSSPILNGKDSADALQKAVRSPLHGRELVRRYQSQGYDLIKAYGYLEDETLVAILDEGRKIGMPVAKHGPHAGPDLPLSALAGLQSIEHVEDVFQGPLHYTYDVDLLEEYIHELAQIEPYFTPTLAVFDHLVQLSVHKQDFIDSLSLAHINPTFAAINYEFTVKRWLQADQKQVDWNLREREFLLYATQRLEQAGIKLLVGSDAGALYMQAGVSTHREMQLMQEAGITPASILRSATHFPAQALGLEQAIGLVDVGMRADLVLSEANPLEDIAVLQKPSAVVKGGVWLDEQARKKLLQQATQHSGFWVSGYRIWEDVWARWRS